MLASGGWDNTVKLWDIASSTLLWAGGPTRGINCMAFAPDGHLLVTGGSDTFVRIWDSQSGTKVRKLAGQGGAVYSLAWSPDGRLLASGCSDGNIWLWKPQSGSHVHTLTGHTHWVTGLAFAPDGAQLASASADGTVKLWDMESFDCLQTFTGHTDRVLRVAWSPDGRTLRVAALIKRSGSGTPRREDRGVVLYWAYRSPLHCLHPRQPHPAQWQQRWHHTGMGRRKWTMSSHHWATTRPPSSISTGAQITASSPVAERIAW